MPPTLYVLTGPTAVGKSALAVQWAQAIDAEIVSCDAFQVYRGMDIGTAKPTLAERGGVPHHLLDLRPVAEPMDVLLYRKLAIAAIHDIASRQRNILITGGSGFYLKSFYASLTDGVTVTPEAQAEAETLASQGLPALLARLNTLNPRGLGNLDVKNSRRVQRALERCLSSGLSIDELTHQQAAQAGPFDHWPKRTVLLCRSATSLHARAKIRAAAMIEQGLIPEVINLRQQGLENNPSAATAIGYRETLAYLDCQPLHPGQPPPHGHTTTTDLTAAIALHTRQLAAKQKKWFRHQLQPDRTLDLDTTSAAEALTACLNLSAHQKKTAYCPAT